MASRKAIFSKKERKMKIRVLQNDGHISNKDITSLLHDVDDGDDDMAQLMQDLEYLAGLEQQYQTTNKQNRRSKDATSVLPQSSVGRLQSQSRHKQEKQRNVCPARNTVRMKSNKQPSESSKLLLPHPPGYIPSRQLDSNTVANTTTPQTKHNPHSLPPIQSAISCRQSSNQEVQSHRNTKNQHKHADSLLPTMCEDKVPNMARSRANREPNIIRSRENRVSTIARSRENKEPNIVRSRENRVPNIVRSRENKEPNIIRSREIIEPTIVRSRKSGEFGNSFSTKTCLPPIQQSRKTSSSDNQGESTDYVHNDIATRKDTRKDKRPEQPNTNKRKKRSKVKPLIQPDFVF